MSFCKGSEGMEGCHGPCQMERDDLVDPIGKDFSCLGCCERREERGEKVTME